MKEHFCVAFLACAVLLGACAPSPAQSTATAVAAVAQTQISAPTATYTPTAAATYTVMPTATFTPTSTSTPTSIPMPTSTPMGGGSGRLIFSYWRDVKGAGFGKAFDLMGELNVFTSNWDGTDLTPVTNGLNGYNFVESISPDGRKVLVSSFSRFKGDIQSNTYGDLYLVALDGSTEPKKLASYIYRLAFSEVATWLDDTRVVYIGMYGGKEGLFLINVDGTGLKRISESIDMGRPYGIFPTTDNTRMYWRSYLYRGAANPDSRIWSSSVDETAQQLLLKDITISSSGEPSPISPDGTMVAFISSSWDPAATWIDKHGNSQTGGFIGTLNMASLQDTVGNSREVLSRLGLQHYALSWSPDSSKVLLVPRVNYYPDLAHKLPLYLLSIRDSSITELPISLAEDLQAELNIVGGWSPDSRQITIRAYIFDEKNPQAGIGGTRILNLDTITFSEEFTHHITEEPSKGEPTWGPILWLP